MYSGDANVTGITAEVIFTAIDALFEERDITAE